MHYLLATVTAAILILLLVAFGRVAAWLRRNAALSGGDLGRVRPSWLKERAHLEQRVDYHGPAMNARTGQWPVNKLTNEATMRVVKRQVEAKGRKRA